jgi:hypothetical protein
VLTQEVTNDIKQQKSNVGGHRKYQAWETVLTWHNQMEGQAEIICTPADENKCI